MVNEQQYYNQSGLWGIKVDPYQIQVREDILNILPDGVRSVIDVGCGDGYIIKSLSEHIYVVGMDFSKKALSYIKKDVVFGSITDMPFLDLSFDLVMANDTLEHIPSDEYQKVLEELTRVASRYLLITVPYSEQLEANQTKCAVCGVVYHVNWHQRSYDVSKLRTLFEPTFKPLEIRFSGDVTRPPFDPTIAIRHSLGCYAPWEGALCPECGSKQQENQGHTFTSRLLNVQRSLCWIEMLKHVAVWNDRTEVIALYARSTTYVPRQTPRKLQEHHGQILHIDFSNPLQVATPDFVPGVSWAKFSLPDGATQTSYGVKRLPEHTGALAIPVRLPVKAELGDCLRLEASGAGKDDVLCLYAVDGLHGARRQLVEYSVTEKAQGVAVHVTEPWWPDRFGLALEIHVHGQACLHTMTYEPHKDVRKPVPFVCLELGHNVMQWEHAGITYSWGLLVHAPGYYVKPGLNWVDAVDGRSDAGLAFVPNILSLAEGAYATLQQEYRALHTALEQKEQQRSQAEHAYTILQQEYRTLQREYRTLHTALEQTEQQRSQAEHAYATLQQEYRALHTALEQTEQQRTTAENAYASLQQEYQALNQQLNATQAELQSRLGIKGGAKEVIRGLKRRLIGPPMGIPQPVFPAPWQSLPVLPKVADGQLKVLVLSHMYPHPDQPLSGPFVHEQVRALRQYQNIEARVLVGRPYWMLSRNPLTLLRMNKYYHLFHDACQWFSLDGVPVKYLPYRVLRSFWMHGWAYRTTMYRHIDQLRADFPFELIHAHTAYLDGSAGLALAKRYHVPLLITEHTNPFSYLTSHPIVKFWTLHALNRATKVLAVSGKQQQEVSAHMAQSRRNRVLVVHNGVAMEDFYPPAMWSPDPATPRLLFVGHLAPYKNVPLLFEAFAIVVSATPGASLKLVGGSETTQQESELRSVIHRLGLEAKVMLLGAQPRAAVTHLMREEADLLVLSSHSETFGCVLIEALACGKPVVSTRSGGPEDIVTAHFLGELCVNENSEALARAIMKVVSHLPEYSSQRIRQYIDENFSYRSLAQALRDLYYNACNTGSSNNRMVPSPGGSRQRPNRPGA